ncbi:MAG: histidine phosphatase family protein [Rhizobium sp.]|nr:histidine phosphatase family protein [Rhizobium sp.]
MLSEQRDVFRLYLLRHAHAAWPSPGGRDFDRALDARGLSEARSIALQAYTAGLSPEKIISSTARRCVETTGIFLDIFGDLAASYDDRLYSEGPDAYLDQIQTHQSAASLMLVGHNPMIEALAALLPRQGKVGASLAHGYPTAGLLALDFQRPLTVNPLHRGEPALLMTPALT